MKKLLITGASGLMGKYLIKDLAPHFNIVGTVNSHSASFNDVVIEKIDLTDGAATKAFIEKHQPDCIIHTVALTSVDECEENPAKAHTINAGTTQNLIDAIKGSQTKFIYISTDHIFDGKETIYSEESPLSPLNIYAKTKIEGENVALTHKNSLVLRTNFYGGHTESKPSFSSWIYNELKAGKKINMFDDVFFSPISICAVSENLRLLASSSLTGIYNFVGNERLSKYDFGLKMAQLFDLPANLINPTSVEKLNLKAPRPKEMALTMDKLRRDLPGMVDESVTDGLLAIKEKHLI